MRVWHATGAAQARQFGVAGVAGTAHRVVADIHVVAKKAVREIAAALVQR